MAILNPNDVKLKFGALLQRRHRSVGARIGLFAVLSSIIAVALGTLSPVFARHYWFADVLTNFVPQYVALAALACVVAWYLRRRGLALLALSLLLVQLVKVAPLWMPAPSLPTQDATAKDTFTVFQFNVNSDRPSRHEVVDWILAQPETAFDVLALIEVRTGWQPELARLYTRFPYHVEYMTENPYGVALFSRYRLNDAKMFMTKLDGGIPSIVGTVVLPSQQAVRLYVAHPYSPRSPRYAKLRNALLNEFANIIASDPAANKMLVADMNTTRWSPYWRDFVDRTGFRDAQEGFGWAPTWPAAPGVRHTVGVMIDQTLVSETLTVLDRKTGPNLYSDHMPVTTRLELRRPQNTLAP